MIIVKYTLMLLQVAKYQWYRKDPVSIHGKCNVNEMQEVWQAHMHFYCSAGISCSSCGYCTENHPSRIIYFDSVVEKQILKCIAAMA